MIVILFSLHLYPLLTTLFIVFCEKLNNDILNRIQCVFPPPFTFTVFPAQLLHFLHLYYSLLLRYIFSI